MLFSSAVLAQDKETVEVKPLNKLKIDGWDTEKDLPNASLVSIYQAKDGYLWLGSYNGLIRFDGLRFTNFDQTNVKFLQSPSVNHVTEDKNGTLWIATTGSGLLSYRKGIFKYFGRESAFKDYTLTTIMADKQSNSLWIGTRTKGIWIFDLTTKKLTPFTAIPHITNSTVISIIQEPSGKIWIGTEGKGLFSYDKGEIGMFSEYNGKLAAKSIISLLYDKKGVLWVGTNKGLFNNSVNNKFAAIADVQEPQVTSLLEDAKGHIWVGTSNGIFRKNSFTNEYEHLASTEIFPKLYAFGLCEDHEGSIWASLYNAGLLRIKESNFINYTRQDGLASKAAYSIVEYNKGEFLVGTDVGIVNKIVNGNLDRLPVKTVLEGEKIRDLYKDKAQNLWISSYLGLLKIAPDGTEKLYTTKDGLADIEVRNVHEHEQTGDLWIATKGGGVTIFLKKGGIKQITTKEGLCADFVMSMRENANGNMFIATNDGGFSMADREGNVIKSYSIENGLNSNLVFNTHIDIDDRVWIATSAGLSVLIGNKIINFDGKQIGLSDAPFDIVEDNFDFFWLPTRNGVVRINRKELLALVAKKVSRVVSRTFDKADGMKSASCTGAVSSYVDSKNHLWFPTLDGISGINPNKIQLNETPPPVVIESLQTDTTLVNIDTTNIVIKGAKRIEFHFTAMSLVAPKDIQFRYRLVGYDKNWIEGQKRDISYTNLSPGKYEFQVTASNNDGVWNPTLTKLSFEILPEFYQTIWFYALVILATIALFYGFYRLRIAQISLKNKALARIIAERTSEINQKKEEIEAQANAIHAQKMDIEKAYQRIQTLTVIGQQITTQLNLKELVKTVYEYLHLIMSADGFGIGIYHQQLNRIEFTGYMERGVELPFHHDSLSQTQKLSVNCFITQKELVISNFFEYSHKRGLSIVTTIGETAASLIYLPLTLENKPIGVITVQSFDLNAYGENELAVLKSLVSYISIAIDNANKYEIIAAKNQKITDSIHYAKHIQDAMLPPIINFENYLGKDNSFVLYKPKDIVSGDFYWVAQEDRYTVIAVVDCTGHGVPGAFMSMIGNSFLSDLVLAEGYKNPTVILKRMNRKILDFFNHNNSDKEYQILDGMDAALLILHKDLKTNKFVKAVYAGAMLPLYYAQDGVPAEIKATKKPIGDKEAITQAEYASHEIDLTNKKTNFYLFSDGYADQFGEQTGRKYRIRTFRDKIFEMIHLTMPEQLTELEKNLQEWQGNEEQTDDITVVGLQIDNTKDI
jgi:ligand-binding sensor domain-containing protein/serine phosphatase RsbU (regulator of sigma subunit)